jgi:hypothetical protein
MGQKSENSLHMGACLTYIIVGMAGVTVPTGVAAKGETGRVNTMKAFVLACAAMAVIGVGAHFTLASLELSASNVYATDNVRQ